MIGATLSALVLVPALLAPGATKDRIEILERDVRDLRQELLDVRQQQTQILLQLEKLNGRVGEGGNLADFQTDLEQSGRDIQALMERMNDGEVRVDRMEERLRVVLRSFYQSPQGIVPEGVAPPLQPGMPPEGGAPGPGGQPPGAPAVGAPPAGQAPTPPGVQGTEGAGNASAQAGAPRPPAEVPVDPEEMYQTAYSDFARGNYELAIMGFQEYLQKYPASEFADNAQYWIGEANYSMERYPAALDAFQGCVERYPEGDKVPDSMLKKGYTLIELNRMVEGIRDLQTLIRRYPDSTAARMAKQRLEALGLSTP